MKSQPILLLALGNDIMGDDAVGLVAGRILHQEYSDTIDFIEASTGGIDLIELISGYEHVLLLDAIMTEHASPGLTHEYSRRDFEHATAPSPHAAGLPEAFQLANSLGITLPQEFKILAFEVNNVPELREGLTSDIQKALPSYIEKARRILQSWL